MDVAQRHVPDENPNEAGSLATELAHAYQDMTKSVFQNPPADASSLTSRAAMVRLDADSASRASPSDEGRGGFATRSNFYRDKLHLSPGSADHAARGLDQNLEQAMEDLIRIRERAPDQVTWGDLQRIVNYDPDEMVAAWAHLKAEAREELATGHRTARALEWNGSPWDRVRFLAIRDSFRDTTPPQTGIGAALVETAAEAFSDYLQWTGQVHTQASSEVASELASLERHGSWSPARLSAAEAIEQSAKMAERARKRFLQTIKMFHELQRTSPTLYVGNAGQINVGQQQVNVASPARKGGDRRIYRNHQVGSNSAPKVYRGNLNRS